MKKHAKKIVTALLVVAMLIPTVAMIFSSAAEPYPVELAFNNLFVFEKWATNQQSTTLVKGADAISGDDLSEGATLSIDIPNGKIEMVKDVSVDNIYTACSMSVKPEENKGYYTVNVNANTEYEFSYNLSGTTTAFAPYIFFFDSSNSYIELIYFFDTEAGTKKYKFTTPENASHFQIRFGINDTAEDHPDVSTVNAVVDTIKISEVPPLPKTGNLFRFDDWADTPSSKIATGNATLTADKINNTFTMTRTSGTGEIYNFFSMNPDPSANAGLYSIEVDPGTEYSLSYTTYNASENALNTFFPLIIVFDEENKYIDSMLIQGTSNANIDKNESTVTDPNMFRYDFVAPENAGRIQIRFTLQDTTASSTVSVKNIVFCNAELVSQNNLFDYDEWLSTAGTYNGGISVAHQNGTLATNADDKSIAITMNSSPASVALTYFDTGAIDKGYAIPVEEGKTYTINFNLDFASCVGLDAFNQVRIFTAWYNSSKNWTGKYANYFPASIANHGENSISFTVPTGLDVKYVELAFACYKVLAGAKVVLNSIEMYETDISGLGLFEETGEKPTDIHRMSFTYEKDSGNTYGTLPTPSDIPEGYVFAGWYTGKDGTGTRIDADTPISYDSFTVYSKYEPAVDTLSIKTMPTKLTYTVGEKFNPAGLVLTYGINTQEDTNGDGTMETVTKTTDISTGYYCTPEYLNTVGTQAITVSYGGKTATFNVTVTDGDDKNIIVNGANHAVKVANNLYTLNYTGSSFNRYEITYFSDAYARGIITFDNDTTEEFFIEPSDNGHFASYIDNFLINATHTGIKKISFTGLSKDYANIELLSLTTVSSAVPTSSLQYYENEKYKVGIDLAFGGVISYIECLEGSTDGNDTVTAATYTDSNGDTYTKVDYKDKLPSGAINTVESVNLINTWDRGRYLQQSYYGTDQRPFIMGDYNGVPWNYNPVQGGNVKSTVTHNGGEASKVIDYRITESQIYVKTRPLDWGKNSIDSGAKNDPAWNTPSYMEAWYTFTTDGKGLIQGSCRFIDYSGYPAATTTQEFPALYTVEPLNHFVYNNVTEDQAWAATQAEFKSDSYLRTVADTQELGTGAINIEEPEFWGILPSYAKYAPNKDEIDPDVIAYEHWAAFTASEDKDSFGIGIYSPGVTDIHYGCFVAKYDETQYKAAGEQDAKVDGDYITALKNNNADSYVHKTQYRHASTLDPAVEMNTSYIAPIETLTFESYKPISYTYYVSTGTADEIREDFRLAKETEENAQKEITKIAVPETVYMTPVADGATHTTIGKNYVNNALSDLNAIYTIAEPADNMYFGLYALDAKEFTVNVTNAKDSSNEIDFYTLSSGASAEGETISCADSRYRADNTYGLRFTGTGLKHGEKATAKWEITVTLNDNTTKTYTAYTVLYAPERTVGAVAEARRNSSAQNELSSWITGANGVDHSQRAPLGSFKGDYRNSGYFRVDPLANPDTLPTGGSAETAYDYIILSTGGTNNGSNGDYQDDCYVMQTATSGEDDSRSHSYLGLLKIDKSRYSNTDQIPNLKIGYDALRVGGYEKDSFKTYNNYYTLGTETAFTSTDLAATPSGWTTFKSYSELYGANGGVMPYRETVVPSYTVSDDLNGKYIHAIAYGRAYNSLGNSYSTAGTSVLISITDKSELRDAVLDGYDVTDGTPLFNEKLQNAATVLGDPSATQEEIDNAKKELSDASKFALKYDNLFSALEYSQHSDSMKMNVTSNASISYNAGTLTVISDNAEKVDIYAKEGSTAGYYNIKAEPSTEYILEYDVTTLAGSQVLLFFYDENGNQVASSNQTLQVGSGAPSNITSTPHFAAYVKTSDHVVIKFKTNANIDRIGFRFGNTDNVNNQSTFSNIRLIDSAHYYEGASYEKTEAAYAKDASYASLITPTRPGYTFDKWVDSEGNTVSASDVATNHLSVFSVWTANTYTITYNPNGGSVSPTSKQYTPDETVTLPKPTHGGYVFSGWKVTTADGNWTSGTVYQANESVSGMYGNATLTAQWTDGYFKAYFDTILDFSKWNTTSATNATITDVTSNGFTLTSNAGAGEGTSGSPQFAVTAGKTYYVDVDIEGDNWDIYFFFRNDQGKWLDSDGPTSRSSSDGTNSSRTFTAPEGSVKADIRLDANGSSNSVKFSDIRIYEVDTRASNVDVPFSSKNVTYDKTFGELPVPTREGYTFLGWYDGDTLITAESKVTQTSDVYLKSKWVINDSALVADTVVVDFAKPIEITPLANDTVYASAEGTKTFLGISSDGTNYGTSTINGEYGTFTVSGEKVTYKPTTAVNGTEVLFYHASVTDDNGTTNIKSEIAVVPASNVLYEEDKFAVANTSGKAWSATATAGTGNQEAYPDADGVEVYGYDSSYNKIENYSNSSALSVTVDSKDKRSQNIAFTFEGTGFDLNSACGPNTGVMIVSLRDNNATNTEGTVTPKVIKSYIVDTYYSDLGEDSKFRYGETLYQVPIISETALSPSNYTIQIVASWLPSMSGALNTNSVSSQALSNGMNANTASAADNEALRDALADIGMEYVLDAEEVNVVWFDEDSVLNGGEGANTVEEGMLETQSTVTSLVNVIDSVRVYNPITDGDQYYISSEQGVKYYNVIDNLTTKDSLLSGTGLFAYIMGIDKQDITVENYSSIGPKDELYLASGTDAVTFTINSLDKTVSKVMISLRAAAGTPTIRIGNGYTTTISSNTDMYYDITKYVGEDGTVVIQNTTPGTLLSIGYVKLSGVVQPTMLSAFNLDTALVMMSAPSTPVELNVPQSEPDVEEPGNTTEPTEPTDPEDTTDPTDPEDTTDPTDPEDTTDPDDSTDTTDPADPDDSVENWFVRLINWIIATVKRIVSILNRILGF